MIDLANAVYIYGVAASDVLNNEGPSALGDGLVVQRRITRRQYQGLHYVLYRGES